MTSVQDEKFVASNGLRVFSLGSGWLGLPDPEIGGNDLLSSPQVEALREYFTVEHDKELGRWRNPEKPNEVAYPLDDGEVRVLDERDSTALRWSRAQAEDDEYSPGFGFDTARAYYAAHPEPEKKPWHDAQHEEVWEICMDGANLLCRSDSDGDFTPVFGHYLWAEISNGSPGITAGRRIWPETEEEDQ